MAGENIEQDVAVVSRIDVVPTILDVVCRTTGLRFAAVARVTDDRWMACSVNDQLDYGVKPGDELMLRTTLCDTVRANHQPLIIDRVSTDPFYRDHPTPLQYGFESYVSMPIFRADGAFFGTLCALDTEHVSVDRSETFNMFRLFADLIGFHLDAQDRLRASEVALSDERERTELREQFIAVLGHDLRNPLASITAGTSVLRRQKLLPAALAVLDRMDRSVFRMAGLINNVLDFARGRLGGGFKLTLRDDQRLEPELEQVVAELRAAWPQRQIDAVIRLVGPVKCDRSRIAQMLSNLLANALTHGAPDAVVRVEVFDGDGMFHLSVSNRGEPIPAALQERLFQPFFRASERNASEGLGLGLFIASEIASAHLGALTVRSDATETRFTFSMPKHA